MLVGIFIFLRDLTSWGEALAIDTQDPVIGISVHLWLDPLDFELDAVTAILDRLHCVA